MHDFTRRGGESADEFVDFDTVAADPARFYDTPAAVVADDHLTRDQKLRFLREWALDLQGNGNAASPDAVLLRLVRAAIADIEARRESGRPPRTAWPRRR